MINTLKYIFLALLAVMMLLFAVYTFKPDIMENVADFWDSDDDSSYFIPSRNFTCGGKWIQQYQQFHANSLKSRNPVRKFLVFYCPGHSGGCGGYGNRMMGLISTFYLAVLLNRTFLINWGGPEVLESYLKPNKIDWRYNEHNLKGLKSRSNYWGLSRVHDYDRYNIMTENNFYTWVQKTRFEHYLDLPVEKIAIIWYFANKLWDNKHLEKRAKELGIPMRREEYPYGMMGCAMNFLFKKSRHLMKAFNNANEALKRRERPFIGIHIRTSDHHFGSNNEFSYRTRDPRRVYACAKRVEKALKKKNVIHKDKTLTWFLAADDVKLKHQSLKDYPRNIITLDIEPRHLEHSGSNHGSIFRDLMVDMLLLLECDFFIPTRASTYSFAVLGTRQFSTRNFVFGEPCSLDKNNVELASPPQATKK